jgi:hypothetical protein
MPSLVPPVGSSPDRWQGKLSPVPYAGPSVAGVTNPTRFVVVRDYEITLLCGYEPNCKLHVQFVKFPIYFLDFVGNGGSTTRLRCGWFLRQSRPFDEPGGSARGLTGIRFSEKKGERRGKMIPRRSLELNRQGRAATRGQRGWPNAVAHEGLTPSDEKSCCASG